MSVTDIVGRELTEAEKAIDVLGLDAALNKAKTELARAIEAEKKRAIRRLGGRRKARLEVTRQMLAPLERLHRLGRSEAAAELERLGYDAVKRPRAFAVQPRYDDLAEHVATLREMLRQIGIRIDRSWAEADLSASSEDAIFAALLKTPGARAAAAEVVSAALTSGLTVTFEANADAVPCWEYTAVLDGGTCDPCESQAGREFHSLDELYSVLPGFGPNPSCRGGGRCRCRAVPCAPDASVTTLR